MIASGITDKVVILGMGCTHFGERWDVSPTDLMSEAFEKCLADAAIEKTTIEAAWFGAGMDAFNVGPAALPLAMALRLSYPGDQGGKYVCYRDRGISWCSLCSRLWCLRYCAGTRG